MAKYHNRVRESRAREFLLDALISVCVEYTVRGPRTRGKIEISLELTDGLKIQYTTHSRALGLS